jgi:hypothetical protein
MSLFKVLPLSILVGILISYYATPNRTVNSSININNFVEIPAKLNNVYGKISKVKAILVNDKVDHYLLEFEHNSTTGRLTEELFFFPKAASSTNNLQKVIDDNYCVYLAIDKNRKVQNINLLQQNCE